MRKLKIYLDTSVISFLYADDSPEKREITVDFFDNYLSQYDVYISNLVLTEINNTADKELKDALINAIEKYSLQVLQIPENYQELIFSLARTYIGEKVIPENKIDDAVHIAICTIFEFDILLSWNFRHIANIKKQMQVASVNKKEGYLKELFLFNPMEVIYEKG
ncbi:MAG: PIN domain-containing protein [Pseudomonadota bacterium]